MESPATGTARAMATGTVPVMATGTAPEMATGSDPWASRSRLPPSRASVAASARRTSRECREVWGHAGRKVKDLTTATSFGRHTHP